MMAALAWLGIASLICVLIFLDIAADAPLVDDNEKVIAPAPPRRFGIGWPTIVLPLRRRA